MFLMVLVLSPKEILHVLLGAFLISLSTDIPCPSAPAQSTLSLGAWLLEATSENQKWKTPSGHRWGKKRLLRWANLFYRAKLFHNPILTNLPAWTCSLCWSKEGISVLHIEEFLSPSKTSWFAFIHASVQDWI